MDDNVRCPVCGARMVKRMAKQGARAGQYFYGCSNFGRTGCRGVVNIPVERGAGPRAKGLETIFMDTVAVPQSLIGQFSDDEGLRAKVMNFAKWRIDFAPAGEVNLTEKQVAIMSVIEKIVNRGRVTRLSRELEEKIMKLTGVAGVEEMAAKVRRGEGDEMLMAVKVRRGAGDETLMAVKLAQRFQMLMIELVRVGKIGYGRKCRVMFDERNMPRLRAEAQWQVLGAALEDLRALARNVAKLYGSEAGIFDKIELVREQPEVVIVADDNYDYDQAKVVYVQDVDQDTDFPLETKRDKFAKITAQKMVADEAALKFVLNYVFRFKEFRPNQIDGVRQTLQGEDSIVLLPTGSGKSVVYQLLSLVMPGMVVVIDPIISLIEDQVDNLNRQGMDRVAGISSATKNKDLLQRAMEAGRYNLVFMAPERLQIENFREGLREFCRWSVVPVCAIDEAHCVSEWGHDFRTSYLNLAETCRKVLRTEAGAPAILALTGTASEAVLRDMERDLKIDDRQVIRPGSFDRKEIEFVVVATNSARKNEALREIIEEDLPGKFRQTKEEFYEPQGEQTKAGIIFCPHVNGQFGVTRVLEEVSNLGIAAEEYSGKKPRSKPIEDEDWDQYKSRVAKQYKDNVFSLLAATKSFGMGIDKPNIRYTIHYGLPQSIESYYQEAGRAGRDRKQAYSYIIVSNDFPERNKGLLNQATTLEELAAAQKCKRNEQDDVTRMLYFHTSSFGGIEGELKETRAVLGKIGTLTRKREAVVAMGGDREKMEKVIYRLSVLGVVKDYTINYGADEFNITLNAFDRGKIVKSYGRYVRGYQDDDNYVRRAEQMMREVQAEEAAEYVVKAMEILLREFVYKIIENSRRQAFANLLEVVTRAGKITDETERSKMVRGEILKFLGNTQVDLVKKITDSPEDLRQVRKIVAKLTERKREDLYAEASRALEAYPQHPSLMLTRVAIRLGANDFEPMDVANTLVAIIDFSMKLYGVRPEVAAEGVAEVLEDIIGVNEEGYMEIINILLQDDRLSDETKGALIDAIPEDYREIGLMNSLNKILEKFNKTIRKEQIWTTKK